MHKKIKLKDVKNFWEKSHLFKGEIKNKKYNKIFFNKIYKIFIDEIYDARVIPSNINDKVILDLGSGPGLWTRCFYLAGAKKIYSCDLTVKANTLVKKMINLFKYKSKIIVRNENAEKLKFKNSKFDHVHCTGVIHHTVKQKNCIDEIARVLKKNGTATIGLYYDNFILKNWNLFYYLLKFFKYFQPNVNSRGRSGISNIKNKKELVRVYDGNDNPIGTLYTKQMIYKLLNKKFKILDIYLNFFPFRFFNFKTPKFMKRILIRYFGFLIFIYCEKK